jgi:chromate reductase, NAD(P)H dehydrogenase (quinone)
MKVLALSGSLRAASINSAVLRAAVRLARPPLTVRVYAGLGELPLFNPDLEPAPPAAVTALRVAVAAADALLIASPEYARGVTGTIKNALDWLVSCEAFVDKPVAVLNTSARAHVANAALRETLRTMSARLIGEASVTIALLGAGLTEESMMGSPEVAGAIKGVLAAVHEAVGDPGAPAATFRLPQD